MEIETKNCVNCQSTTNQIDFLVLLIWQNNTEVNYLSKVIKIQFSRLESAIAKRNENEISRFSIELVRAGRKLLAIARLD